MAQVQVIVLLLYFFGMLFADVDRPVPVSDIHVLVGQRVELPCDVSPPPPQGDASLEFSESLDSHSGFSRTVKSDSNMPEDAQRWWERWTPDTGKLATATIVGDDEDDQDRYVDYDGDDDRERDSHYGHENAVGNVATAGEEVQDGGFLVLWFFDPDRKPIYSLDVRGRRLTSGRHWWDEGRLGRRAFFVLATADPPTTPTSNHANQFSEENATGKPSRLQILNVTALDAGIYRCRVDYRDAPTRNVKYKVTVIGKCLGQPREQKTIAKLRICLTAKSSLPVHKLAFMGQRTLGLTKIDERNPKQLNVN